ncbi:tail fiber protein [Propionibacteriaceae bacterium Y2011]|uniref:tail fiber protein n=1 Tax=Microlunatus sp. Y2014 TaxID=3418488 RepID=UPI003B4F80E5
MTFSLPVGTICPFAGQVLPVVSPQNGTWQDSSCAAEVPAPATPVPDVPTNHLEDQGWMLCNGRWLGTEAFPELFAVLGNLYGTRDAGGSPQFRLPDYRGVFLRGFDGGAGLDPDADSRIAPTGSGTLNAVGSFQCDALQEHTHRYDTGNPAGVSQQGQASSITTTNKESTPPVEPARVSKHETRPKNIAVNYIIRFR